MASFIDLNTIANDATFQGRCIYALEVAAVNVMAESNQTAQHEVRTNYARTVLNGSVTGLRIALAVLTNPSISAEADASKVGTGFSIPDSDIQFTVNSLFNALAGIGS